MSSPVISTVIFDFDGVLADTERLHLRAFQRVFATRGWTLDEGDYFDRYLGYDDAGLIAAFNTDTRLGLTQAELDALAGEKEKVFSSYIAEGTVLFPGAAACVECLADRFKLGIASGALKSEIRSILGAAALLHRFPVIVSAEDVSACKPDPEPYLAAARQLGADPASCLAIEDSPPGLEAARAAGMKTIGVTTTATRDVLIADLVVDNLTQISPGVIAGIGRR